MLIRAKLMISILVGLLFLAPASSSAQALQTRKYELELSFEPAAKRVSGRAVVFLPPSAINDDKVRFDITCHWPGVSISRVSEDSGHDLDYHIRDANKRLEVELGGAQDRVAVEYSFPVDEASLKRWGY